MSNTLTVGEFVRTRIWTHTAQAFNQAAVNTLHWQVLSVGASAATDADCATQLDSLIHTQYTLLLSSQAEYRGVQAQILAPIAPFRAVFGLVFTNANAANGTVTGPMLPTQVSGLISIQTVLAGPRHRGRIYIPFAGASDDGGSSTPSAGYITKLNGLRTLLNATLNVSQGGRTASLLPVVMHRKAKDGTQEVPTLITGMTSSGLWATQRRRGDFGRSNKPPI